MSYAIISLGGKQYRVSEGQRLLVGGDGAPSLSPKDVTVTVKVVGRLRGPKIRIGKYKKRTGYKRHTGFRATLTQIEIESIGAGMRDTAAAAKEKPAAATQPVVTRKKRAPAEPAAAKKPAAARKPAAAMPEPDVTEEGES